MTDRLPPRLREVSTVGVYSPSGAFADAPDKLALYEAGLAQLRGLGLTVVEAEHTHGAWHHASGTPQDRVADLRQLLNHPEVDLIVPSIGGHVTSQMLPLLDVEEIAASGKALVGFSDNALLPLVLADRTGTIGVHHGADVTFWFGRFAEGLYPATLTSFTEMTRGRFDLTGSGGWRGLQTGTASGRLLGGNLKGLASLAGTPWWPDWSGAVLFWESADPLHAVCQHLTQLANAGVFDRITGMVIGRVSTLTDTFYPPERVLPVADLLLDVLGLRGRFPIVVEADLGHDVENVAVPVGADAVLDVTDETVTCDLTYT